MEIKLRVHDNKPPFYKKLFCPFCNSQKLSWQCQGEGNGVLMYCYKCHNKCSKQKLLDYQKILFKDDVKIFTFTETAQDLTFKNWLKDNSNGEDGKNVFAHAVAREWKKPNALLLIQYLLNHFDAKHLFKEYITKALWKAVFFENLAVVRILLKHGADPNYINDNFLDCTPLQYAIHIKDYKTVEELLKNGANPNMRNHEGISSLSLVDSMIKRRKKTIEKKAIVIKELEKLKGLLNDYVIPF